MWVQCNIRHAQGCSAILGMQVRAGRIRHARLVYCSTGHTRGCSAVVSMQVGAVQ